MSSAVHAFAHVRELFYTTRCVRHIWRKKRYNYHTVVISQIINLYDILFSSSISFY